MSYTCNNEASAATSASVSASSVMLLAAMFSVLPSAATAAVPPLSADSLMKVLELPGVGVARGEPPQYMQQLYSDAALTAAPTAPPYGATAVTAVTAADVKGNTFSFGVPTIAKWERLLEVEFHLHHSNFRTSMHHHQHHNHHHHHRRWSTPAGDIKYKVTAMVGNGNQEDGNRTIAQLVSERSSGWFKFRLGAAVVPELLQGATCTAGETCSKPALVVTVTATSMDDQPIKLRFHHNGGHKAGREPLLVFFTKTEHKKSSLLPSLQELVDMSPHHRDRRSISSNNPNATTSSNTVNAGDSSATTTGFCNRLPLMVNFEEIGWSSWILHPAEYNAYYCSGSCLFPIGQDLNPTNHAVVQTIVRTLQGNTIPTPYCVPRAYADLPLLYYDPEGNVVLRNYEQMVVESCGCH